MSLGDIIGAISSVAKAYGTYKEHKDNKANLEAQAKEDKKKAKDALMRGALEAERSNRQRRALIAKQRATMGASGVQVGAGTFGDVLNDTNASGEEDEATITQNAVREAWGYRQRAKSALSAAKAEGSSALIGGLGSLATDVYQTGTERKWW